MKQRIATLAFSLFLCLGIFSATALAGDSDHTDHTGWMVLTEDTLAQAGETYTLNDGKYYFEGQEMMEADTTLMVTGTVTLCLNPGYRYTGEGSAIKVAEGGDLTICSCPTGGSYTPVQLTGDLSEYLIENSGTLTVAGGYLCYGDKSSAVIYNAGILKVTGGSIQGDSLQPSDPEKTRYGIYNADGGKISLGGSPEITGTEKNGVSANSISTADSISAVCDGVSYSIDMSMVSIHYRGGAGPVVTDVTGRVSDYSGNWWGFSLCYPENAQLDYDETAGILSYAGSSSLAFLNNIPVMDGVYYKVETNSEDNPTAMEISDENDYDILWDEKNKTLTLNGVKFRSFAQALFRADCETFVVKLIGENTLTAERYYSSASLIENSGGNVVLEGDEGSALTMNLELTDQYTGNPEGIFAGITALGSVENRTELTVNGYTVATPGTQCQNMTAVSCNGFTNEETFAVDLSGAVNSWGVQSEGTFVNRKDMSITLSDHSCCGVECAETFENQGNLDIQIPESSEGVGIDIVRGSSFTNTGVLTMDFQSEGVTRGIQGIECEDGFVWKNGAQAAIEIQMSGTGTAIGAMGGAALTGTYLTANGSVGFFNDGSLDITVDNKNGGQTTWDVWPAGQPFDTIGFCAMSDGEAVLANTGSMNISAYNGYAAGVYLQSETTDLKISQSGTAEITATAAGKENSRAVGIFAQISDISDGMAKSLLLELNGGRMDIHTSVAEGFESVIVPDHTMAICLSQRFLQGGSASEEELQQIILNGTAISPEGEAVVLGPLSIAGGYHAYINTIAGRDMDGTAVPMAELSILPQIPGTVSIEGELRVGSTLTANVSGLPSGLDVEYQWQSGESLDGTFTDIEGANGRDYQLTNQEAGKYIRVIVRPKGTEYGGRLVATSDKVVSVQTANDNEANITGDETTDVPRTGDTVPEMYAVLLLLAAIVIIICRRTKKY